MYMLNQFYGLVTGLLPYPSLRVFVTLIMASFAIVIVVSIVYAVIHVVRILKDIFLLLLG